MVFQRQSLSLTIVLVAVLSLASARAETTAVTLSGIARDGAKAPVAGVSVTATNNATKALQTTTTGADGRYSLSLAPGSYSVKAWALGFRQETLSVEIDEPLELLVDRRC